MEDYKPVSISALLAAAFAILAVTGFLTPVCLAFTVPSLGFAAATILTARRYPIVGRRVAIVSIAACTWLIINVPAYFYVSYVAEAPPGYERLNLSETVLSEHVGQQVCFKGFGSWSGGPAMDFCLSPDGDFTRSETLLSVELKARAPWALFRGPIAVSGVVVEHHDAGPDTVRYGLERATVRKSKTPFAIGPRTKRGGC